jgi:hypothetical protein
MIIEFVKSVFPERLIGCAKARLSFRDGVELLHHSQTQHPWCCMKARNRSQKAKRENLNSPEASVSDEKARLTFRHCCLASSSATRWRSRDILLQRQRQLPGQRFIKRVVALAMRQALAQFQDGCWNGQHRFALAHLLPRSLGLMITFLL